VKLRFLFRASGGPWGGIKVDDAFQEYLLELFGFETIASLPKNEVIELERSFESFKRKIDTGNEFLLVTIYFPKTLQPREWFSTHLMA
jgi:hypothetical protein